MDGVVSVRTQATNTHTHTHAEGTSDTKKANQQPTSSSDALLSSESKKSPTCARARDKSGSAGNGTCVIMLSASKEGHSRVTAGMWTVSDIDRMHHTKWESGDMRVPVRVQGDGLHTEAR